VVSCWGNIKKKKKLKFKKNKKKKKITKKKKKKRNTIGEGKEVNDVMGLSIVEDFLKYILILLKKVSFE